MSKIKIDRLKDIYGDFPELTKEILSNARIYQFTELNKIPKKHRSILLKDQKGLIKQKDELLKNVLAEMPKQDRNLFKKGYDQLGMQAEILGYDLDNADEVIYAAKQEIKRIKGEYDTYSRGKKKEANKRIDYLRSKVLMYSLSREKIKVYYDAISKSPRYGLQAIKIRTKIEKKQRAKIAKIDKRILALTKIVNEQAA